jgi:HK97 family phage major capsid protein
MESVNQMKNKLAAVVTKAKALRAELEKKGEAATEEEHGELAKLVTEGQQLKTRIRTIIEVDELEAFAKEPEERVTSERAETKKAPVLKRFGRVRSFSGRTEDEKARKAYRFGMFAAAALTDHEQAKKFCAEQGISLKTMKESVNTAGGFLVPDEFDNDLIDLREQYGTFRRNSRVVPMMRDTKNRNRRVSGLTAYFANEAGAATESEKGWDQVSLTAQKLITLTRMSAELYEDAMVNLGDDLAEEIAYAFALKEDQCGFLGDGTSTYGGIMGLSPKFLALSGTIGNIAGLVVASGNLFSEFLLSDFNNVVGKLPEYADGRAKWYCSRFFWASVMQRLALAVGGVTAEEVEGKRMRSFLGYPVEVSQVMPKTDANSQIACYFGDLRLSSDFGDRRQTTIAISDQRYFDTDEIGIKGTERFDINNHDLGNADAAAANRVEGPLIGLISAAA